MSYQSEAGIFVIGILAGFIAGCLFVMLYSDGGKPSRYEQAKLSHVIDHINIVKDNLGDYEGRLKQAVFLLGMIKVKEK